MRENTRAMAVAQVTEAYLAATTSQRLAALYADSVLPQAKLALQSALAGYQVGTVDFLTLITNFTSVLDAEIAYQEQQTRYHQALARLEPLAGVQLVK
jgi:outer membrane protein TolC